MRQLFLKVLTYTIAIGVGVGILGLLVAWSVLWYSRRPVPWKKMRGELVMAQKVQKDWFSQNAPSSPKDDDGGFDFSFVVTNSTGEDFQISSTSNVRLYMVNNRSQALVEEPAAVIEYPFNSTDKNLPILFPAGRRIQLTIHLAQSLSGTDAAPLYRRHGEASAEAMPRVVRFLRQRAPDFGGFAVFDDNDRCEIDLPWQ